MLWQHRCTVDSETSREGQEIEETDELRRPRDGGRKRERRGVVTVIEREQTPGTAAEASPSIQDSELAHISPPQQ